ncbi:hypothetical protein [Kocuria marina]|uniref:hypothetical protein n=1 Tax=Kocuria marina TaxID=223184 RepID=UPI00345F75EF
MANPNPFDFITGSAARRVPGLPGQAWANPDSPIARMAAGKPAADGILAQMTSKTTSSATRRVPGLLDHGWANPDSPIARMAAGKPATDNSLMQMMEKNRMNPVNDWWTGKDSPIGRATNWHSEVVNDAVKSALAPYSTATQGLVPPDLLRGMNVAAGVAAWGSKGASFTGLPVGVTARPLALGEGTAQAVRKAMIGLPAGPKGPVWEIMMGKQLTAAMAPFGVAMDMARTVSGLTQVSGLQSVMQRLSSQAFPPGWASLVKIKPASVPLSNLGAAATEYAAAARRIHETLGVEEAVEDDAEFRPTADDAAYEMLARLAPEVAAQVDTEAASVKTHFWQRRAVRNSLAWTAWGVLHLAIFCVMVILPSCGFVSPWAANGGSYALSRLEAQGFSPKAVKDKIAPPKQNPADD